MSTKTDPPRWTLPRIIALVAAVAMTILILKAVVAMVLGIVKGYLGYDIDWAGAIVSLALLAPVILLAALCWWAALGGRQQRARKLLKHALMGGALLGSIGLLAPSGIGLFVPTLFGYPLGPNPHNLPVEFLTGPSGFIVGVFVGTSYAFLRTRTPKPPRIPEHESPGANHSA